MPFEKPQFREVEGGIVPFSESEGGVIKSLDRVNSISGVVGIYKQKPEREKGDLRKELENIPEYREYKNGRVTLDSVRGAIKEFDRGVAGREGEKIKKLRGALEKRVEWIERGVRRYSDSARRHSHLKASRFKMDDRSFMEELSRRGNRRRQDHNILMGSLGGFTKLCGEDIPRDLGFEFSPDRFFTGAELQDRNLICKWALEADMAEKIKAIEEQLDS